jgi:phosphate transport system substrate-binding protein
VVDPKLPDYKRAGDLSGRLRSQGSSGLSVLLNHWSDEFKRIYPSVEMDITGGGSGTALPALLNGSADMAPMSRAMGASELEQFQTKFGYAPTRVTIALDAIAIFVNKNNPLTKISLAQLDGVFSVTRKRGAADIKLWGQLGLDGDWREREIILKTPDSSHGMYILFREMVLQGGDFRYNTLPEPVSTSIVQGVGTQAGAIGFASYFYDSRRSRPLAVSTAEAGTFFEPTQENCTSGKYPLTRFLYIYVNRKPGATLNPLTGQFLTFVCSKQGQETLARGGSYPLSADVVARECLKYLQ